MNTNNEKTPNPKEIEKDISDLLAKKYGAAVKLVPPVAVSKNQPDGAGDNPTEEKFEFQFDMKPDALIGYLDQYVVRQDAAKEILATKICTHFNRIQQTRKNPDAARDVVGGIKNNILMIGPTGVGKTYMIRLIAQKLGVPFVKGDATKFSETGYVGGDVEDLVRDLVREADNDLERAKYGIVYIDEIDKIAGSRNLIGADVSRTGVQRALLKPMEETEVDMKVPHDPVSMFQEIEQYRKTGSRTKRSVSTRHILFIMSGAFGGLSDIIEKRLNTQPIGFGAKLNRQQSESQILARVKSEDLVTFGFESEFVGRLPVRSVFGELDENDLFDILKNPNNPVILGKRLDFSAYGINIKFHEDVLKQLAVSAQKEHTGARGLVSAVEKALLPFERKLPSTGIKLLPATVKALKDPKKWIHQFEKNPDASELSADFEKLTADEITWVTQYLTRNKESFSSRHGLSLTPSRIHVVAIAYSRYMMDLGAVIKSVKKRYGLVKQAELLFFKKHDINIVLEDEAVDFITLQMINGVMNGDDFSKQLDRDFEMGLKLARDKVGKNRFFISKSALVNPEEYISRTIRRDLDNAGQLAEPAADSGKPSTTHGRSQGS